MHSQVCRVVVAGPFVVRADADAVVVDVYAATVGRSNGEDREGV